MVLLDFQNEVSHDKRTFQFLKLPPNTLFKEGGEGGGFGNPTMSECLQKYLRKPLQLMPKHVWQLLVVVQNLCRVGGGGLAMTACI